MISVRTANEIAERVERTKDRLGCGLPQAKEFVAKERGTTVSTINRYMRKAKRSRVFEGQVIRPKFTRSPLMRAAEGSYHVVGIGDAHDAPTIPNKERFYWLGQHVRGLRPDGVVQIGDMATFDSLCRYIDNGTHEAWNEKTTFDEDIESLREALAAFNRGLGDFKPAIKHITLGNHEDRVYSFGDRHPEIFGMMVKAMFDAFDDYGWTTSPFGEVYYIGGVGFVHVPLNEMGKPYGGKTAETRIANDATTDLVIGHSHKHREHTAPKIGHNNFVRVFNLGCAMPNGHIERYAKHSTTGWTYGVADLLLRDGHIDNWNWTSMKTLEDKYG